MSWREILQKPKILKTKRSNKGLIKTPSMTTAKLLVLTMMKVASRKLVEVSLDLMTIFSNSAK